MQTINTTWGDMESGERDEFITRRVMGLEIKQHIEADFIINYIELHGKKSAIPRYSTNILDAWKLAENFFVYRVEKLANRYGYEVTIWDEYSISHIAKADTLPIAICLAALKAKGVVDNES